MKINQLKAGVVLTYLSTGLSMLISLLYTPIMLGILGQSEYGVYTLVNSIVANLGILSFGFGSAYIKFYSAYKVKAETDNLKKLNGMYIIIFLIIAIITLIVGGVLVGNVEAIFKNGLSYDEIATARILIIISVINMALSFPASVFTSYINAKEKYIFLKIVNMIKTVFSPFITLPVLLLGFGSIGMVSITLAVNIFADILNIMYCLKKLNMRFDFYGFNWHILKEIWIFSAFVFLNIITDQINWNVDKFLLGIYHSSSAVAIYGVAAQLNNHYTTVFWSIANVFIPRINIYAAKQENFKLNSFFIKIGRIQFMILALILEIYLFFGKYFIVIWAGEEYIQSYTIGAILLFSVTIEGIQSIGITIQRAKNMHRFRSIMGIIISFGNLLLSIPMCKYYGAIGASIGTAIALIIGNGLIMNIYYHKKVGIDIIQYWKSILTIFPALIIPSVYGVFMNIFYPIGSLAEFTIQTIAMIIIYSSSVWVLGMNQFEKKIVLNPLKNL